MAYYKKRRRRTGANIAQKIAGVLVAFLIIGLLGSLFAPRSETVKDPTESSGVVDPTEPTAPEIRDIRTGPLTETEKAALAGLKPENWPGTFANLKGVGTWFYSAANVDVSAYIQANIYSVMTDLFTYEKESNLTLRARNSSNYAKMLVEGYWGSREGTKHSQFTTADFQVGDLFCAKGVHDKCQNTYYTVAMYQGDGKFLSVVNCTFGSDCLLSCYCDTTSFFADDLFAQTDVGTCDYYFVLRPSQLAAAES